MSRRPRRPRGLRPEEAELWARVAATMQPLQDRPATAENATETAAEAGPKAAPEAVPPQGPGPNAVFLNDQKARDGLQSWPEAWRNPDPVRPRSLAPGQGLGSRLPPAPRLSLDLAPGPSEHLAAQPLRMDPKTHRHLHRGKLDPEARIDLHGMTLAEAHPELIRFIIANHEAGRRLVLVITGKGKLRDDHGPIPARLGVLRHQVPQWLHMAPLRALVLQVVPAHLRHGGAGAYYVYLRRGR